MDIDLLHNKNGDFGLVVTGKFESPATAAIFDHETHLISLEFAQTMESMELNIPVSFDFVERLGQKEHLFIIGTDRHHIHEAYRIQLMHVNDLRDQGVGEWK